MASASWMSSLRSTRSASLPQIGVEIVVVSRVAVTTQVKADWVPSRSEMIRGSDEETTLVARIETNIPSRMPERASRTSRWVIFGVRRALGGAGGCWCGGAGHGLALVVLAGGSAAVRWGQACGGCGRRSASAGAASRRDRRASGGRGSRRRSASVLGDQSANTSRGAPVEDRRAISTASERPAGERRIVRTRRSPSSTARSTRPSSTSWLTWRLATEMSTRRTCAMSLDLEGAAALAGSGRSRACPWSTRCRGPRPRDDSRRARLKASTDRSSVCGGCLGLDGRHGDSFCCSTQPYD